MRMAEIIRCGQDDGDGMVCINSKGLGGLYCGLERGACDQQIFETTNENGDQK